jgi:hypothetical protein
VALYCTFTPIGNVRFSGDILIFSRVTVGGSRSGGKLAVLSPELLLPHPDIKNAMIPIIIIGKSLVFKNFIFYSFIGCFLKFV